MDFIYTKQDRYYRQKDLMEERWRTDQKCWHRMDLSLYVSDSVKATFEIGYRCQVYLGAIQTMNMASEAVPPDVTLSADTGEFAVAFNQANSNFMLTGPYASVGFEF